MNRSYFAKGVVGAVAAAMAVSAFASASQAQTAVQDSKGYYYDPCKRDTTARTTTGALIGGALGAAAGSNVAAHGRRKNGAIIGGVLGALVGGGVGKSSAACDSTVAPPPAPVASNGYDGDAAYRHEESYDDRDWAYGRRGERYHVARNVGPDGCTLAESPIYLPDGRVQNRFVRVCRDADGRYQVVD